MRPHYRNTIGFFVCLAVVWVACGSDGAVQPSADETDLVPSQATGREYQQPAHVGNTVNDRSELLSAGPRVLMA